MLYHKLRHDLTRFENNLWTHLLKLNHSVQLIPGSLLQSSGVELRLNYVEQKKVKGAI